MSRVSCDYRGLVVIVPTRNRSGMAIEAIRSVLAGRPKDLQVLVSDNSTDSGENEKLRQFCDSCPSRSVRYIRPDEPLGMALHWDWVLQKGLELYEKNHFT